MSENQTASYTESYIKYLLSLIKKDKGIASQVSRADNPAMEYQIWEILAQFKVDFEKPWVRLPFVVVSASLAKEKAEKDGALGLGKALARCYDDGYNSDQAKAKLRRVIGCDTTEEACHILRPLLSLIRSKGIKLKYSVLLSDLLHFGEQVKIKWTKDFYSKVADV